MAEPTFDFQRSKGIVWVCDLARSSSYLNDNAFVDLLEIFLPRLLFISRGVVAAADGRFIKWTGDGFLAWFELPLDRLLGERTAAVFNAAWHLAFLVNVTQLGLSPQRKFRIRQGITYEKDALLMEIPRPSGEPDLDIIGRGVVLATRLSGIEADFPSIATQRELVEAVREFEPWMGRFQHLRIGKGERLKHFKGEAYGTKSVYASKERTPRMLGSLSGVKKEAARITKSITTATGKDDHKTLFSMRFQQFMGAGPEWCRAAWEEEHRWLHKTFDLIKQVAEIADKLPSGGAG
jgi:class 3 adenylate cyclase